MTIARRKRPNRVVFVLLAALALAFPAVAAAQTVVTGQMTATFDGEERTWHLLEHQSSARTQTSSSMGAIETFRGRTYSLNLQGQAEERFGVEGSLALGGMLESLDDCPCGLDLTDLIYFTSSSSSSSMFSAIYKAIESEVSVETIERIDEGVYSVSGSFRAVLGWIEDTRQGDPDPSRTVTVEGTFAADRVLLGE